MVGSRWRQGCGMQGRRKGPGSAAEVQETADSACVCSHSQRAGVRENLGVCFGDVLTLLTEGLPGMSCLLTLENPKPGARWIKPSDSLPGTSLQVGYLLKRAPELLILSLALPPGPHTLHMGGLLSTPNPPLCPDVTAHAVCLGDHPLTQ